MLHRLDRQVSGVLLLPRNSVAAAELGAALRDGRMCKRYLARVHGRLTPGLALAVAAPIRVRSADGRTATECHEEGKPALTLIQSLAYDGGDGGHERPSTLVLCEPVTGRSHQLRLHLQRIGHPIIDDQLYGPDSATLDVAQAQLRKQGKRPRHCEHPASESSSQLLATVATATPPGDEVDQALHASDRQGRGALRLEAEDVQEEMDEIALHAWSYSCDSGPRTFSIVSEEPWWARRFCIPGQPSLQAALREIDEADAPIVLDTEAGRALLSECEPDDRTAFDCLWPAFAKQVGKTMCGPASIAMALRGAAHRDINTEVEAVAHANGLPPLISAARALLRGEQALPECGQISDANSYLASKRLGDDDATQRARALSEDMVLEAQKAVNNGKVLKSGMTLGEVGLMLRSLGIPSSVHHARQVECTPGQIVLAEDEVAASCEALRKLRQSLRSGMSDGTAVVLLNYHMSVVGHRPFGGHFSPLAAYHAGSNRWLVLDVWPDTPASWIGGDRLWASLIGTDAESGLSRGWVVAGNSDESPLRSTAAASRRDDRD